MKKMDEDDRIKTIVAYLKDNPGKRVAVMVDVGEGHDDKGDRYIRKIREGLPGVRVLSRVPGPGSGGETIIFQK